MIDQGTSMDARPIDTGWSWVICFSAGVSSFFVSGPLRCYGIMFVEIIDRFQSSSGVTAIALALVSLAFAFMSPIAANLGERFNQKTLVALGSVCTFLGTFLTSFAPNVIYVCLTFGILTGIGLACIFSPSMVMIGYYFDKRRALANGLATAGGSLGQLCTPLLFTYLLKTYSFQGGLMVFSALLLHVIPAALLLRPITTYRLPQTERKDLQNEDQPPTNGSAVHQNGQLDAHHKTDNSQNGIASRTRKQSHSLGDLRLSREESFVELTALEKADSMYTLDCVTTEQEKMSRANSLYLAPYQNVPGTEKESLHHTSHASRWKSIFCFFCRLYDWELFRNRRFLLYALGMCTGHMGYVCTCMFIPPFASEKSVPDYQVALLMSITGGADLVGRIIGGWVGDLKFIKRNVLSGVCLVLTGVLALGVPLVPYYSVMVGFCIILGAIGGTYVALMLSVVIDLVGLAKVSPAFSLAIMGSGLTAIPTPIMLGVLRDHTGTYDWSLVVCGILLIIGGALFVSSGVPNTRQPRANTQQ